MRIDIDELLTREIDNVVCITENEPDMDLMAAAFYDIYLK